MKLKLTSDPKSMIVYANGDMLVATCYHGHEIKNEIVRRVNAYDKLKEKLKEIEKMSENHGNAVESIVEINKFVVKTLKEI